MAVDAHIEGDTVIWHRVHEVRLLRYFRLALHAD
jgi:mRNA-degrading endonuclease YafQ of YafQ-DinJ toxin-antitoxin module